jgi:hypothetical protein
MKNSKLSKVKRTETIRLISFLENQTRGEEDSEKLKHYREQIYQLRNKL